MAAIWKLAILGSAILVFPLKLTHTCQDWFPPFAQKKPSLIHSDSTWWWQPSRNLPCWIQTLPSWIQTPSYLLSDSLKNTLTPLWLLTQINSIWLKLIHSDSTWWWQPSWILPCWIQTPSYLLSDTLKNNSLNSDSWLKLFQSDSNLFILTQLNDGSHLEFYYLEFGHLGFSHLSFSSQTHSLLPRLVPTICTKNLHSFILTQLDDGSLLEFFHVGLRKLHSFILTQLDDGSHLEFCHVGFRHLAFFSQIHSKTFSLHSDSDST